MHIEGCAVQRHFGRVWPFATFMDGSLPGSSVYEILQARILEWVWLFFSFQTMIFFFF